ncbi:hypothetical protein SAMD00019534_037880 [Acytostelium subglobosum LB1]|uniref:hypothetical protein n=1 Tax=Acytostelium subglobosum LB1 TaxID=1410327 RepID=UPI000644F119|nr:hypothetical protein SAMD00019534_037880 [Acytostelium subglobosum LB1]GAM20613.1 hypothetical protein SAMD00019534_037880 [Acytostelium subglobosum LB1]|eukprot:XP_012760134.1 hypothetical protein SAMD00019534_037880 [Acytostelium subglobosum LB1]
MVPPQQELICSLELECSRNFGSNKYSFYYPIQLDNFLITCWKTTTTSAAPATTAATVSNSFVAAKPTPSASTNAEQHHHNINNITSSSSNANGGHISSGTAGDNDRYCCTIYEDGSIILPTLDKRMKGFSWAKSFSKKSDFSKEELELLLSDLYSTNSSRRER